MPKAKKPETDTSILDLAAPSLDKRLSDIYAGTMKLAQKWGFDDAVSIPGKDLEQYRKRVYSTGLLSLDDLLKIGGIPRGHIVELFGTPSAGKSLLLYQMIREIQYTCTGCTSTLVYADVMVKEKPIFIEVQMLVRGQPTTIQIKKRFSVCTGCKQENTGGLFVLYDQEATFDPLWAEKQGIELTKFIVLKLPTGEHALEMLRMVMTQYKPDGIGIDSISQLQPRAEQDRSNVDDATLPGLHAKIMSQLCRHVTSSFLEDPKRAPAFIWVNQLRADVTGKGALKVTGGYAPEFYSSIRLYLLRRGPVNQLRPELGVHGRITVKKCKAAEGATNRTTDYVLLDSGFEIATDIYQTAVNKGIFLASSLGSGKHFWAEDTEKLDLLAGKKDEALDRLRADAVFAQEVRTRVLASNAKIAPPEVYLGDFPSTDEE